MSFCNWLSFTHGHEPAYSRGPDGAWKQDRNQGGFRLADAGEWQFAARFGFDFLALPGAPRWNEMFEQFDHTEIGGELNRRLVNFRQTGAAGRPVDEAGVWLYPLGLRDLCGNAGELCLAETSTPDGLQWTVCGGKYSMQSARSVMPWSRGNFQKGENPAVGFRVVLPVPMENFLRE